MPRAAEISLTVLLDDSNIPTAISWTASDAGFAGERRCAAATLTLWDAGQKELSAIGLWTRDTQLADMYAYLGQTLGQLADTCRRATGDEALARRILACADDVAARASALAPAEFERAQDESDGFDSQNGFDSQDSGSPESDLQGLELQNSDLQESDLQKPAQKEPISC